MAFPYKHVLMIGATAGIGNAMASRFVQEGLKVTAVGRRKDRLDAFVQQHGKDLASSAVFDIGDVGKIPQFAEEMMGNHPDIDCVFLNAGIQLKHDFSKPEKVDLEAFANEVKVNFTSFVVLTTSFLHHLLEKPSSGLIYTGSNLAIVPAAPLPAYSASKAALNAFVLCLRAQLDKSSVKVIEISPPPVQTELHDTTMGSEAGRKLGMPLDQFTNQAYDGLISGSDQIVIGGIGPNFQEIVDKRRGAFDLLTKMMTESH